MKITIFISSLYGGGAERVTCNLASYLAKRGHQIEILTMSETEKMYELDEKVSVCNLLLLKERRNKMWNALIRFPRFWKYLKARIVDVYVVMLPKTTILLLLFRWMTNAKIIAAERVDPAAYSNKIAKLLKRYARKADGWVFQTEDARAWYGDSVQDKVVQIIPNAINPVFIRPLYEGAREKEIVAAGRLNGQKNFALLINAFATIADIYTDYTLTIYGEGPDRQKLQEQIAELGLSERISLPGNVTDIADRIQKASMYVLSSDFEGMPNALMEAMALGLPCIATDCPCGGPRYLIQNGKNGLLVPVGDINGLANAMNRLLSSPKEATEMGTNARDIVEKLAPENIYDQWQKIILKTVNNKGTEI